MHSLITEGYDWRAIVAANKPGSSTVEQRERGALLQKLVSELHEWAARFDLWMERVPPAAYNGVVSTRVSREHYAEASLVARYILWIFSLDDYLDRAHLTDEPNVAENIEDSLTASMKPIFELAGLTSNQITEWGFGWMVGRNPAVTPKLRLLRDSLIEIYHGVALPCRDALEPSQQAFVVENFALQLARMLGTWRDELRDSAARRAQQADALPSLEAYLERGTVSIGAPPVATIPTCFEANPESAWKSCSAAIESGGRIARLCNDFSNYEAEVSEMKVNAVTLALAQLGLDPRRAYDSRSLEMTQAREIVRGRLADEVAFFAKVSGALPDSRLCYWVRTMPAFAIAMYEKGNYVEPV